MLKPFLTGLILIIMLLPGCKIDRDKKVDRVKFQFETGDDSEIFFRNVRQIYYDRTSPPDGTWQAYRFSNRYHGNARPVILPVIVINWLKDEAYLLIDTNEMLSEEDYLEVIITDSVTSKSDTLTLNQRGREHMLEFGSKLYEAIQANEKIEVRSKGKFLPVLNEDIDRETFRVTMSDYYRLTRVF
jgi:hypothetical protein